MSEPLHNPAIRQYLDPAIVRRIMDICIARGWNLTVYVDKKDGTSATYNGHPNPFKSFVGGDAGAAQSARLKANCLAYIKRPDGRPASFYLDKVRGIAGAGQKIGSQE